ncbi:Transglutaminase-like superfamily protein [Albimonas donghaensis]|uniref:Transglutaminase-like superfamily protein n=1 Tax=Albimonas donghaensis TaxID=356660 RepID=A0A1H2RFU6_9RHOB|nr:lasso peptide biosynthesis B2 protein [Albimonas donghaensis]SDW18316.1 Transglutaminase-like superfamily protein [Albimonas donghaensis]
MTAPGDRPPRRGWRRVFEPGELRAALDAFRYLARARILHARFPASRLIERLRAPADGPRPARLDADSRERMRRALIAVSRRMPWRSDCMIQSLAARMWLDRLGVPCAFRLGATRGPEGIAAHAWIEVDGHVVTGGRAVGRMAAFMETNGD